MSRVLIAGGGTGGHLYPALALGAALAAERPGLEVHYVGARRGIEARVLPARGEPHTLLPLEPLRRSRPWTNWRLLPSTLGAWRGLARLFGRFRPELVVGTGGYASGLACFYAVRHGVPLVLHEQNSYPGLTTRLLARAARQIHLGYPEAAAYLKPGRGTEVLVTGNAIRPPDPTLDRVACRRRFGVAEEGVVALVVGGSQGARAVNQALLGALEQVAAGALPAPPTGFQLLWATGPAHAAAIEGRLASLGVTDWVHAVGYIDAMPEALAASDLALSRAGAMMTSELLAWGMPSLLVPLPTSAAGHQEQNARALATAGAAVHLPEGELTPALLWSELLGLAGDAARREGLRARALERARPDAAREMAGKLLELVEAA